MGQPMSAKVFEAVNGGVYAESAQQLAAAVVFFHGLKPSRSKLNRYVAHIEQMAGALSVKEAVKLWVEQSTQAQAARAEQADKLAVAKERLVNQLGKRFVVLATNGVSKGDIDVWVHKAGCQDIPKALRGRNPVGWPLMVYGKKNGYDSVQEALDSYYDEDMIELGWLPENNAQVMPCCK